MAAGAPVCAKNRLTYVAAEFEQDAARGKERVCYFGAEARLESVYGNSPQHAKVLLGAQPSGSLKIGRVAFQHTDPCARARDLAGRAIKA